MVHDLIHQLSTGMAFGIGLSLGIFAGFSLACAIASLWNDEESNIDQDIERNSK